MDNDNFNDLAKHRLLWEHSSNDDVSAMLSHSDTNTLSTPALSIWTEYAEASCSYWKGKYKYLLSPYRNRLEKHLLSFNGYARQQAIEMRHAQTSAENEALKSDKKGILSVLGLK